MKKITLSLVVILVCNIHLFAQAPQGFNYQAVIRDSNGEILADDLVSIRFTLHEASANGANIYQEIHTPTTNEFGLVNVVIGQGAIVSGTFDTIEWGSNLHFLQVEVDISGGFVDLGTQQLMSVPYALSSEYAERAWGTSGNLGTDATQNFIGTIDDEPLAFKVGSLPSGLISSGGATFFGYKSGTNNLDNSNTAVGFEALEQNVDGHFNTALGYHALKRTIGDSYVGNNNTGVGFVALGYNSTGRGNTALGSYALWENHTGNLNTAIGDHSLLRSDGSYNTAVGHYTLYNNRGGDYATAIGTFAMEFCNSSETAFVNRNVAIGYQALRGPDSPDTNTGNNNTAVGFQTLLNNTTGNDNTAIGNKALNDNTSGNSNTAIGYESMASNILGFSNTAVGYNALTSNVIGDYNTSLGMLSLMETTAGNYNTATGYEALRLNILGDNNTAVGKAALYNCDSDNNTALGFDAGGNQTTGSDCTFIGYSAEGSAGTYTNATAIGNQASVTASNRVRIGNTAVTQIGGQVAWSNLSDARLKKNVQASTLGLEFINKLNPVTYNFIEGHEGILYTGFLAQDVERVLNEMGVEFSGVTKPENETDFYAIRYAEFVMPLVNAVKEQQVMIEDQRIQIDSQQASIKGLEQMIVSLQRQMDDLVLTQANK